MCRLWDCGWSPLLRLELKVLSYSNDTAQPFFLISGRASSSGSLIRALPWTDVGGDEGYVVSPLDRVLHRRHREPARTGPPAAKPCGDVLMKIPIQGSLEMRRMSRVHTFDLISRSKEHRHRSRRRIFSSQLPLQLPPQPLFHPTGPPSAFLSLIGGCVPGVWFVARVLSSPASSGDLLRVHGTPAWGNAIGDIGAPRVLWLGSQVRLGLRHRTAICRYGTPPKSKKGKW